MSKGLGAACLAASAALMAGCALVAHLAVSAHALSVSAEPVPVIEIKDAPAPDAPPLYYQADERWGGLPYAGADLATSGCGLTCAAMAWEHLSGTEWTPVQMLNAVGNSCVQDGQNYMPGFCEWMRSQDPTLDYTVLYEDSERALRELSGGRLVFGAMSGRLVEGGQSYGGHIVLLAGWHDDLITIHDPCAVYEVQLTRDGFAAVAWDYFISIGRE